MSRCSDTPLIVSMVVNASTVLVARPVQTPVCMSARDVSVKDPNRQSADKQCISMGMKNDTGRDCCDCMKAKVKSWGTKKQIYMYI
jgi:hypothetical protein